MTALAGGPNAPAAAALLLGTALLGLGGLFLSRPREAAHLFGLPVRGAGEDYVRALGVRDLALAGGLAVSASASPKALAAVSGLAAMIPVADAALVRVRRGSAAAVMLHASSAAALALLSVAAWRSGTRPERAARRAHGLDPALADLT
jgi:hypothetical protein